jgi:oligopeptide/dipeptide ABC transporter ATP-binding protein
MLLSVRKVIKEFARKKSFWGNSTSALRAVDGVSFEVKAGEIVGLVGESGCGKSTLVRGALALTAFTGGNVFWDGEELSSLSAARLRQKRKDFQMVFQNPQTALNPRHRINKTLMEPLEVQRLSKGEEAEKAAVLMLEQVGLSKNDLSKYPHEFSGGQRQRIGLARAMISKPKLIVLDEPVSSLDVSIQASILNLLVQLNRQEKTAFFFISHDLNVVGYLSQRILVMYLGRIVESGETDKVLQNPKHPYTQALLQTGSAQKDKIKGEAPSLIHRPQGCAFHSRCPLAEDRCRQEDQALVEFSPGWSAACWKAKWA